MYNKYIDYGISTFWCRLRPFDPIVYATSSNRTLMRHVEEQLTIHVFQFEEERFPLRFYQLILYARIWATVDVIDDFPDHDVEVRAATVKQENITKQKQQEIW